jgi:alkylated DNA repair dioxygenase AlkB
MNLFEPQYPMDVLPFDGKVVYFGPVLKKPDAQHYFEVLLREIEWKHDEAVIFGKHITTKRMAAWYGDEAFDYTYSNTTKTALSWTRELLVLKELAEKLTGTTYNSCLLNLYHDGDEGMAWHSDDEKSLGKDTSIASFSLGAERKFSFKHKKTKETVSLLLEHGSLLLMGGTTQSNWWHRLPKTTKVKTARINLTFRTMVD